MAATQHLSKQEKIEEIHRKFNTFIKKANKRKAKEISKEMIQDSEFLQSIGFYNSKPVVTTRKKQKKKIETDIKKINYNSGLAKAKEYYKKYGIPCVSQDLVEEILEKYSLIMVDVEDYTGDIPKKNIEELKLFKGIKEEDIPYTYFDQEDLTEEEKSINYMRWAVDRENVANLVGIHGYYDEENNDKLFYSYKQVERFTSEKNEDTSKATNLRIICPINDIKISYNHKTRTVPFHTAKHYAKDVLDPIVLVPVIGSERFTLNGKKERYDTPMYLVLTMWGLESWDKRVNPNGMANIDNIN